MPGSPVTPTQHSLSLEFESLSPHAYLSVSSSGLKHGNRLLTCSTYLGGPARKPCLSPVIIPLCLLHLSNDHHVCQAVCASSSSSVIITIFKLPQQKASCPRAFNQKLFMFHLLTLIVSFLQLFNEQLLSSQLFESGL